MSVSVRLFTSLTITSSNGNSILLDTNVKFISLCIFFQYVFEPSKALTMLENSDLGSVSILFRRAA